MASPKNPKVLITGFGPFLDITNNPSYEIVRRLQPTIPGPNTSIDLINIASAIPAKYHEIHDQTANLIKEHEPDIVLHMGLAHGRSYFAIEKGAEREGYHEVPDEGRRVFTRGENKKVFGKSEAKLESSLDLESVVDVWRDGVCGVMLAVGRAAPGAAPGDAKARPREKAKEKEKEKGKKGGSKQKDIANVGSSGKGTGAGEQVDVRLSDDVGNYVCGFQYYVSLLEMQKLTGKRNAVFFHVPYLEGEEDVAVGVRVTEGLVRALVGAWEGTL